MWHCFWTVGVLSFRLQLGVKFFPEIPRDTGLTNCLGINIVRILWSVAIESDFIVSTFRTPVLRLFNLCCEYMLGSPPGRWSEQRETHPPWWKVLPQGCWQVFDMNVEIIVVLGWQRSNNRCTGTELPHDLHSACMPCLVNSDNVPWLAHQSGASSLHRFRIRRFSRNLDGEVLCEMSKVSAVAFYLVCVALWESFWLERQWW